MVAIEASFGIALFPEHGGDADALLQAADDAMYRAKEAGGGIRLCAPDLDRPAEAPGEEVLAG